MRTPLPPKSTHIRLTISVTPEVHDTFLLLAKASGMSLSRAMGEWLEDTREGAEFMAQTVQKAREAPKVAARELHAYALGLTELTGGILDDIRLKGRGAGRDTGSPGARTAPRPTPPSNTGVNRPHTGPTRGRSAR